MSRVTITIEDQGSNTVSFLTEIQFADGDTHTTPAMNLAMAARALFENGMLADAAAVALEGIADGISPSECILAHFLGLKEGTE